MRQHLSKIFRPVSKHIPGIRAAAEIISTSPRAGLRLLRDSRSDRGIQSQPDVYPFAAYLGERFECTHVIAMGRPNAKDLIQLYPRFEIVGFVSELDVQAYRERYGFATWFAEHSNSSLVVSLPEKIMKRAVIMRTSRLFMSSMVRDKLRQVTTLGYFATLSTSRRSLKRSTAMRQRHLAEGEARFAQRLCPLFSELLSSRADPYPVTATRMLKLRRPEGPAANSHAR